jgi:enoyl-CoA hydratase/carnithine racemase
VSDEVIVEGARDGVARLTINRPERRNAFGRETIARFAAGLEEIAADPATRVLVITGAGGHFGAGADLKERAAMTPDERFRHSRAIADAITYVSRMKVATIAAIDGYAIGGAFELALGCDLRVLCDRAILALTETKIGAFPGAGGTQRLARIAGTAVAKDMIFTGRRIDAEEALRLGVATAVEPPAGVAGAGDALAAAIAANAPLGVSFAKQAIDLTLDSSLEAGLAFESAAIKVVLASKDYDEGLASFRERRPPRFEGT